MSPDSGPTGSPRSKAPVMAEPDRGQDPARAERGVAEAGERVVTGTIHHIEFWVPDLDRAVASWGWLLDELGYQPFGDWPGGRSRRAGTTYTVPEQHPDHTPTPPHRPSPPPTPPPPP